VRSSDDAVVGSCLQHSIICWGTKKTPLTTKRLTKEKKKQTVYMILSFGKYRFTILHYYIRLFHLPMLAFYNEQSGVWIDSNRTKTKE
jgi:hypothetical protein